MNTKPCEVLMFYYVNGARSEDRRCGSASRIHVNGFPMCARHFLEYEEDDLVEKVELFAARPEPVAVTQRDPMDLALCGTYGCQNLKHRLEIFCSVCAFDYAEDPDAFK